MAKLTYAQRKRLAEMHPELFVIRPSTDMPLGGYPVDTPRRARNALARAAQHASPRLQRKICSKVQRLYPKIEAESCPVRLRS